MGDNLNSVYEKSPLNTITRHKERASYDKESVTAIVRECKILHVAFVDDDGMPQCVPMIGALEDNKQGDQILFLHGHPSSRVYKHLARSDVRVVATGTILDGYVLALSSFGSSMNYRSVVLHGFSLPFGMQAGDDPVQDKSKAFARITDSIIPGRWSHAREPTSSEFEGTAVIRIIIDSASVKVRAGPPVDSPKDLEDEQLTSTIWTGVVPVRKVTGTPDPTNYSSKGSIPEHVLQL